MKLNFCRTCGIEWWSKEQDKNEENMIWWKKYTKSKYIIEYIDRETTLTLG